MVYWQYILKNNFYLKCVHVQTEDFLKDNM